MQKNPKIQRHIWHSTALFALNFSGFIKVHDARSAILSYESLKEQG